MVESFRRICARHPGWLGALGVCGIVGGLQLVLLTAYEPAIPDPASADPSSSAAFIASERFTELNSRQREQYLRGLSARYLGASVDQRRAMEAGLSSSGADPKVIRAGGRELALAMVRASLDGYEQLSPEERQKRLAALRMFTRAMGFRTGTAAALDPTSRPVRDATANTDTFRAGLQRFQRDILDSFSAEERIMLSKMATDIRAVDSAR